MEVIPRQLLEIHVFSGWLTKSITTDDLIKLGHMMSINLPEPTNPEPPVSETLCKLLGEPFSAPQTFLGHMTETGRQLQRCRLGPFGSSSQLGLLPITPSRSIKIQLVDYEHVLGALKVIVVLIHNLQGLDTSSIVDVEGSVEILNTP